MEFAGGQAAVPLVCIKTDGDVAHGVSGWCFEKSCQV